MIFPGFPGVLSFFQVFQVEWEPCFHLHQNYLVENEEFSWRRNVYIENDIKHSSLNSITNLTYILLCREVLTHRSIYNFNFQNWILRYDHTYHITNIPQGNVTKEYIGIPVPAVINEVESWKRGNMATLQLVFHTYVYSNELYTKTNVHLTQSSNAFPRHLNEQPHLGC